MSVVFLFEMIGTVAFAVSGAMTAIRRRMDIFGVMILAMITAVGGGILRDLILDVVPPSAFRRPVYALTAAATAIVVFLPSVRRRLHANEGIYEIALLVMDSIGLGVFTALGAEAAYLAIPDANLFLAVFVSVVTGVGGGIMRDVLAQDMPYVFVKHFYACASMIGALVCALLHGKVGSFPCMLAGTLVTMVLRLLAAHYHWNLPKAEA